MHLLPIIVLIAAVLVSCDPAPSAADPDSGGAAAAATWPATLTTDGGAYSVTLEPTKGAIGWNEHFSLNLAIKPQATGVGPLTVVVDADMPAHRHGMNTKPELVPKGEQSGEQHFRVDGMLFHMTGYWVITVDVTGGGVTERATFPVTIE